MMLWLSRLRSRVLDIISVERDSFERDVPVPKPSCVLDDKLLRKGILQQIHHLCFSTHREHQGVQRYEVLTIIDLV